MCVLTVSRGCLNVSLQRLCAMAAAVEESGDPVKSPLLSSPSLLSFSPQDTFTALGFCSASFASLNVAICLIKCDEFLHATALSSL